LHRATGEAEGWTRPHARAGRRRGGSGAILRRTESKMQQSSSGSRRGRSAQSHQSWLKRSFHRQFRRALKSHDSRHMQWRVVVQREVDKLYRSLLAMAHGKLVSRSGETPEEAIFGVLCMLGDCVLADKWLSQWSKNIRFDFQLTNFCEPIIEWMTELGRRGGDGDALNIKPASCQAMSKCILEHAFAERLEGCTVLHLAALSGDHNMVIAVTTIWEEVVREMLSAAQADLAEQPDNEDLLVRVEQLEGDWRSRSTLGETAHDLVPECSPVGSSKAWPKRCQCSALYNDVPCTARMARKALLASTEAPAPIFFSGIFAVLIVATIAATVSMHSVTDVHGSFSTLEWGGIAFSYVLLWTVLALSSFVRHAWNVLNLGLVMFEVCGVPGNSRPPPSAPAVARVKVRRLEARIKRILAVVQASESPTDADLNKLDRALNEARRDMGRQAKPVYVLSEELVSRAQELLRSRREDRRRVKERGQMRKVASKLFQSLSHFEHEFRNRVEEPISVDFSKTVRIELMRADHFINDTRMKDEDDMLRVAVKFRQVKELMVLREELEKALDDPRDEYFERMVHLCREARIAESRMVKERLKAIDEPRSVLAQLNEATTAENLDLASLERALAAASNLASRGDLVEASAQATRLLNAFKILDQAKTNGRKAHAQLLVSSDHDISHISMLDRELGDFETTCRSIRGNLPLPGNTGEVRQLLQKWKREEGPSQRLKGAVNSSNIEALREAIAAAKEAGIGIKSARKRLNALEQRERIKQELDLALQKKDTSQLREAVSEARKAGVNIDEAKETLEKLVKQESAQERLATACQSNKEDKLQAAIFAAREVDIDCAAAQQQLDALMERRMADMLQQEEARSARREQLEAELSTLLDEADNSTAKIVDGLRVAKAVGVDVSAQVKTLGERVAKELHKAMNPIDADEDNDSSVLSDAIRDATLVNGCGATVDTAPAKERLEMWQKQKRLSRQLATQIENVRKYSDDRTVSILKEMLAKAAPIVGETSSVVLEAEEAISVLHAVMELEAACRTCRVAHEQSCMMHPRVDVVEEGVPEYIAAYRSALDEAAAKGKVPADKLKEMRDETNVWEDEATLIRNLRLSAAAGDADALNNAIQAARKGSTNINIEPPKRTFEKLNKEAANRELQKQIEEALAQEQHDCARLSTAIEAAKAAGLPTYDAIGVLVEWTNEGRTMLSKARASRDTDELRRALEATAAMGLGGMLEWIDAKRFLEGGAKEPRTPKSSHARTDGRKEATYIDNSRHPRWKTELCTHWLMHGSCSYGKERCNFAHGEDDLRRPPDADHDGSESAPPLGSLGKGKEACKAKDASPSRHKAHTAGAAAAWSSGHHPSHPKVRFKVPPRFGQGEPLESSDITSVDTQSQDSTGTQRSGVINVDAQPWSQGTVSDSSPSFDGAKAGRKDVLGGYNLPMYPGAREVEFRPPDVGPPSRYGIRQDAPYDSREIAAAAAAAPPSDITSWHSSPGREWESGGWEPTSMLPPNGPRERRGMFGGRGSAHSNPSGVSIPGGLPPGGHADGSGPNFRTFPASGASLGPPVGPLDSDAYAAGPPGGFGRGPDAIYAPPASRYVGETPFDMAPPTHDGGPPLRPGGGYVGGKHTHLRPDVTPFSPGQAAAARPTAGSGTPWSAGGGQGNTDWSVPSAMSGASSAFVGGGDGLGAPPAYSPTVSPLGSGRHDRHGPGLSRPVSTERVADGVPLSGTDSPRGQHMREQWGAPLPPRRSPAAGGALGDGWGNVPGTEAPPGADGPPPPPGPPGPSMFGDDVWSQGPEDGASAGFGTSQPADGCGDGDEKFYDALLAEDAENESKGARSSEDELLTGVLRHVGF